MSATARVQCEGCAGPRLVALSAQAGSYRVRAESLRGPTSFDLFTLLLDTRVQSSSFRAEPCAPPDTHICSCLDCVGCCAAWQACSDVLYRVRLVADPADVVRVLRAHPGAAVCAAMAKRDQLIVAVRWREQIHVLCSAAEVAHSVNVLPIVDALPVFGSAVHAWLAAGGSPRALIGLALGDEPMIRLRLRCVHAWTPEVRSQVCQGRRLSSERRLSRSARRACRRASARGLMPANRCAAAA